MTLQICSIVIPPEAGLRWRMYNRYGWHQAILRFFGDSEPKTLLWHVEESSHSGAYCTILTDGHLVTTDEMPLRIRTKPYPTEFLEARQFAFEVELSPTRLESATRKKRAVQPEELVPWFCTRSAQWGFRTNTVQLEDWYIPSFYRRGERIVMPVARFAGTLTVTDRERFIDSALHGIGSRRRFGFGLLRLFSIS